MNERIGRALVTGASAGLGAGFARELADRGVELVLVARRGDRLRTLADALPVPAEVLVADLAEPAGLARVAARIGSATDPVDLLVNNAGLGAYGAFADLDDEADDAMIDVNVAALTRLTRAALSQLLPRSRGGVINVGSTAGYQPGPGGAVYGATKAYVRSFTEAVHEEVRGSGVHVMLLAPGFTATDFQQVAGVPAGAVPAPVTMEVGAVVTAGLDAFAARRAVCVPGAANRIAAFGSQLTPSVVSRRVAARLLDRMVTR